MSVMVDDHNNEISDGSHMERRKVRFHSMPTLLSDNPIDNHIRTQDETDSCWWTQSKIRATTQLCRQIASQSRNQCPMLECVEALHRLATSKVCHDKVRLESCLLETLVAKRFVRCSKNFATLRGLEHFVCKMSRFNTRSYIARLCQMQRTPGVTEEDLSQFCQSQSRFDRIMARLLGEADALYQQQERVQEMEDRKMRHRQQLFTHSSDAMVQFLSSKVLANEDGWMKQYKS